MLGSEITWCARCSYRFTQLRPRLLASHLDHRSTVGLYPTSRRHYSAEIIPPPTFENETKKFAPKIQKLVDEISQLTLLEVADLNELLKKTLKIADVPMTSFSAAAPTKSATQEEEESNEPVKQEKSLFTVRMVKYDESKKVAVIKEVKSLVSGMNLVQAKKFVESLPQTLKSDLSKEECEKLKAAMEAVGASVEID